MRNDGDATSGLAIASLAFGVLGITAMPVVGSVIAVALGLVARRRIDRSQGRLGGRGLAVAGMVLGGAGIGGALLFLLFAVRAFG